MKSTLAIFVIFCLITACDKTGNGTPDTDTAARKLFDTLRDNDFEKSVYLMPDKGTFRKIELQNGRELTDVDAAYETFKQAAEQNFNAIYSKVQNWESCKYLHSTSEDAKSGKLAESLVTVKFDGTGGPYKFEITMVKFNNRWYYMGDAEWIPKSE